MKDKNKETITVGNRLKSDIGTEIIVTAIGKPQEYEEEVVVGYVVDNIIVFNILTQNVLSEHWEIQ